MGSNSTKYDNLPTGIDKKHVISVHGYSFNTIAQKLNSLPHKISVNRVERPSITVNTSSKSLFYLTIYRDEQGQKVMHVHSLSGDIANTDWMINELKRIFISTSSTHYESNKETESENKKGKWISDLVAIVNSDNTDSCSNTHHTTNTCHDATTHHHHHHYDSGSYDTGTYHHDSGSYDTTTHHH